MSLSLFLVGVAGGVAFHRGAIALARKTIPRFKLSWNPLKVYDQLIRRHVVGFHDEFFQARWFTIRLPRRKWPWGRVGLSVEYHPERTYIGLHTEKRNRDGWDAYLMILWPIALRILYSIDASREAPRNIRRDDWATSLSLKRCSCGGAMVIERPTGESPGECSECGRRIIVY